MMMGKKGTFRSQMAFYYDLLLKTLHSNSHWIDLMKNSYWFKLHAQLIGVCQREIVDVSKQIETVGLTEDEMNAMKEYDSISQRIKDSTNAARKHAQRELEVWKQKKIGQRWYSIEKEFWPRIKKLNIELASLQRDLIGLNAPERDVEPALNTLRSLGFLEDGLTELGVMASEINEGHQILEPLLYNLGVNLKTPQEIITLLAVFLGEGNTSNPANIDVPAEILYYITEIMKMAKASQLVEDVNRVQVPQNRGGYWNINLEWVEPIWRWVNGAHLSEIVNDYQLFEGNFLRILSKLANILEEWRSLALIKKDTDMLNLLLDAEVFIKAGLASNDSLYLRL
jgi:superfamily II RNA helicase